MTSVTQRDGQCKTNTSRTYGEHLAEVMVTRSLELAVAPDLVRISEQSGLPVAQVSTVVARVAGARATRRADARLTPQLRAQVLLRAAARLESEARTLRRLAMDDPACAGLICEVCGEVMADSAGLARHRTVKHSPTRQAKAVGL